MPHDGHMHHHHHGHDHPHHGHDHPHHGHAHPHDHNHATPDHLHSHPIAAGGNVVHADAVQDFIDSFVAGFRAAEDKPGFLRLAKVPFEIEDTAGGPALKLVDVALTDAYQVATASPAFGTDELVYHPYPGRMVRQRTDVAFVYVSLKVRRDVPLAEMAHKLISHSA